MMTTMAMPDADSLMALDTPGGALMRALAPVENLPAVRRAHAAIKRQLRAAAPEGEEPLELGTVATDGNRMDINGAVFELYPKIKRALKAMKGDTVDIRIHSPGGSAFEGSAVYNLLRQDGRPVQTTAMGIAASAASLIFMAGDTRVVSAGAMLMIHDVWSCGMGNAAELRALAEQVDAASDAIAELYAERAGGAVSDWRARMATDTFLGGDESVALGLATGRVAPSATPKAKAKPKPDADADGEPAPEPTAKGKGKAKGKAAVYLPTPYGLVRTT